MSRPANEPGILDLPDLVASLPPDARARFDRLFEVQPATARMTVPRELEGWVVEHFGGLDAVEAQRVLKITNRVTLEGTLLSPLRSRRPLDGHRPGAESDRALHAEIARTEGDPFCHAETGTPAEPLGRLRGAGVVSGANVAAYDAHHAVLVFDRHDPLEFDAAFVADLLALGHRWARETHATDPAAVNYLLIWNCLWRAGGSIVHGHAQALLGRGAHYPRLERFRRDAAAYRAATGSSYADDLLAVHRDLDLAVALPAATLFAALAPGKEREVVVVAERGVDDADPRFRETVGRVAVAFRDVLGVRTFNLALWRRPIAPTSSAAEGWDELPAMVRLIDRGDPMSRPSDIGAMELWAAPVVGSDPFDTARRLRAALT